MLLSVRNRESHRLSLRLHAIIRQIIATVPCDTCAQLLLKWVPHLRAISFVHLLKAPGQTCRWFWQCIGLHTGGKAFTKCFYWAFTEQVRQYRRTTCLPDFTSLGTTYRLPDITVLANIRRSKATSIFIFPGNAWAHFSLSTCKASWFIVICNHLERPGIANKRNFFYINRYKLVVLFL